MFKGKSDHLVLACKDIGAVKAFYEDIIGLEPRTESPGYITYPLGLYTLCFKEITGVSNLGAAIVHLGIDFETRLEVDSYFAKIISTVYAPKPDRIIDEPGKGPYRFYVVDPNGFTLEFESWEGSSG